jgi:hypothetical protein
MSDHESCKLHNVRYSRRVSTATCERNWKWAVWSKEVSVSDQGQFPIRSACSHLLTHCRTQCASHVTVRTFPVDCRILTDIKKKKKKEQQKAGPCLSRVHNTPYILHRCFNSQRQTFAQNINTVRFLVNRRDNKRIKKDKFLLSLLK